MPNSMHGIDCDDPAIRESGGLGYWVRSAFGIFCVLTLFVITATYFWNSSGDVIPIDDYDYRIVWSYIADDAFITLRYAENWILGSGPVWNNDLPSVDGYSNFLWMLWSACSYMISPDSWPWDIHLDVITNLFLGGIIFSGLAIITLYFTFNFDRIQSGWPLIIFAFAPGLLIWSLAGLETSLFLFLLVLSFLLYFVEDKKGRLLYSAIPFALLALTRTEGAIYFVITLLWELSGGFQPDRKFKERIRYVLPWAILFGILILPYHIWRLNFYEGILPNAVVAKGAAWAGFPGLLSDLKSYWPLIILALCGFAFEDHSRRTKYLFIMSAVIMFIVAQANPAAAMWHRHFLPILVMMAIAAAPMFGWLSKRVAEGSWGVRAVCIVIILFTIAWPLRNWEGYKRAVSLEAEGVSIYMNIGMWLRDTVPPDTRIALMDCGAIPYFSQLPTLDLWGLNDYHIARHGVSVDYVREWNPDVLVFVSESATDPTPRSPQERVLYNDTEFMSRFELQGIDSHSRVPNFNVSVWMDKDLMAEADLEPWEL